VREYRVMNGNPVVFFDDVDDRDAAETLVRAILWIDHDVDETEDNAWFDHQLVGLDVVRDDVVVGRVMRVEHFPAQDLLIVKSRDREIMVPFVEAIVPTVDVAAGRVIVTPPPGLFEELPDDRDDAEDGDASVSSD
jgi:16S rRNA processing protein RimM